MSRAKFPKIKMPELPKPPEVSLDDKFTMKIETQDFTVTARDLIRIRELGRGAYGVVEEMKHEASGLVFAVKRIHSSVNDESNRRTFIELDACVKSGCCPQMVRFYGAMYREGDVWICMEVMDTSLDKFYRICVDKNIPRPEPFIAKVALSVVEGLNFMKEKLNLIHRDVKPSNILLNRMGLVKICDFGISGHLTNSVAKTMHAGCKPYMPPERIDGEQRDSYGVQADVWSLGITLIEIASGSHPYGKWKTPFEQLKQVVKEDPPTVDRNLGYSDEFHHFISQCLIKDCMLRPKYKLLLEHPFLVNARQKSSFDMSAFVKRVFDINNVERDGVLRGINVDGSA